MVSFSLHIVQTNSNETLISRESCGVRFVLRQVRYLAMRTVSEARWKILFDVPLLSIINRCCIDEEFRSLRIAEEHQSLEINDWWRILHRHDTTIAILSVKFQTNLEMCVCVVNANIRLTLMKCSAL